MNQAELEKKKLYSDFLVEISLKNGIISKLETKITELGGTIRKLFKMVRYPRLVKLLQE